jgi:hypothetical protein
VFNTQTAQWKRQGKIEGMTDEEVENALIQPILMYQENERIRKLKSEEFVFSYLIQNKGKGKIDYLVLDINGFNKSLFSLLSDIGFFIDNGLINVLKSTNKSIKLELTLSGIAYSQNYKQIDVITPTYIFRLKIHIINVVKLIWNFFYITLDRKLKIFFNSGWWLLLGAIIAFIYFLLPYLNQINESQKQNIETTKEELLLNESSKKELELLVSSKDSVVLKKYTLPLKKNE